MYLVVTKGRKNPWRCWWEAVVPSVAQTMTCRVWPAGRFGASHPRVAWCQHVHCRMARLTTLTPTAAQPHLETLD